MISHCPKCNANYKVGKSHIGSRITCAKCNSSLVVTAAGIQMSDDAATNLANLTDSDSMELPVARKSYAGGLRSNLGSLPDVSTVLFGAGAFVVILFLFLPLIDNAKVASRSADLKAGENREARLERALTDKKDRVSADEETRVKGRESWKKERQTLQDEIDEANTTALRAPYWYRWGMMLGFFALAAAALGYLNPQQPSIRRVVGAIVIVTLIVLIFIVFVFGIVK